MASPIQSNDESTKTTTTAAVSITEPATTAKNLAINATSDKTVNTNGIDEKSPQQQTGIDTPVKNGKGEEDLQNPASSPSDSGGSASIKLNESPAMIPTTPVMPTAVTTSSSNVSFQTPTSAPRSKPLEKPKPLKLEHQHHPHHMTQSQILFHPAATTAPGAFAAMGTPPILGAIPHPIFVGGGHFPQQQAGAALSHHIQMAMHQHNQQQQQPNLIHPAGEGTTAVSTDEILETMEQINRSVKAGQFSTTLAGHIFRLYGYLKHVGEMMEQSHKTEMNRVFVSLRQACCRDSGQLGTPCRLKIMELVELRAMAWRPNLAHSQYYLNRGGSLTNGFNGTSTITEYNPISSAEVMSGGDMEQLGAAPVSAPPFGSFSINPFAFNIPPTSLAAGGATSLASAAELVSSAAATMSSPQAPSYYLIPASHVGHTQAGIAFISPTAGATVLPPPPISPLAASAAAAAAAAHAAAHQQRMLHMPVSASLSQPALTGVGINPSTSPPSAGSSGIFPRGAVTKTSGKYSRPAKIPGKSQYRDEVVIRNADSGKSRRRPYKVMGVKGRRVAIIEELSKTIISFQKVPQGAKERTLTITGPSEESIEQAKVLIEETIRRNVSPIRGEGIVEDLYRGASLITACFGDDGEENANVGNGDEASEEGEEGKERTGAEGGSGDGREFTIEAGQLGEMLKLQCNDPALLEAAKQALAAYFRGQKPQGHQALRRTTTDAASRDQNRKERRKSMPTLDNQRLLALKQSSPPKVDENQPNGADETPSNSNKDEQETAAAMDAGKSNKLLTLTMMISPPIGKQKASSAARSTPNLAATGLNKRPFCVMKSADMNERGAGDASAQVETKFMADESGGGTLVIHEKKNRVTVRVVYTREFVLQCAASPFTSLTPSGLPWMSREIPEILRPVPGKFDINEYKQMCLELRQSHQ